MVVGLWMTQGVLASHLLPLRSGWPTIDGTTEDSAQLRAGEDCCKWGWWWESLTWAGARPKGWRVFYLLLVISFMNKNGWIIGFRIILQCLYYFKICNEAHLPKKVAFVVYFMWNPPSLVSFLIINLFLPLITLKCIKNGNEEMNTCLLL